MDECKRRRETLPRGGLLLTESLPAVRSVAVGVWVRAGSRDEPPDALGISHFLEHMMFKGTARRNARQIAGSLEGVGGSIDAYTTREYTCYVARVLDEHLDLAFDVIGDCLSHSLFEPEQVEREKQVVTEEIQSYEDTPEEYAADRLTEFVWREHPLGRPILGTRESVRALTAGRLRRRFEMTYGAGSVIVAAAGHVTHERVRELTTRHLALPDTPPLSRAVALHFDYEPAVLAIERDLAQLTICLGTPGLAYADPRRPALDLLCAIVGGSMCSRLFQRVREEEGLAYNIYTDTESYADSGLLSCAVGVSPESGQRALRVVAEEFSCLVKEGLRAGELETMKSQSRGALLMGLESTTERLAHLARAELYDHGLVSVEAMIERLEAVTEDQVMELAREFLIPERFSLVTVGPHPGGPLRFGAGVR